MRFVFFAEFQLIPDDPSASTRIFRTRMRNVHSCKNYRLSGQRWVLPPHGFMHKYPYEMNHRPLSPMTSMIISNDLESLRPFCHIFAYELFISHPTVNTRCLYIDKLLITFEMRTWINLRLLSNFTQCLSVRQLYTVWSNFTIIPTSRSAPTLFTSIEIISIFAASNVNVTFCFLNWYFHSNDPIALTVRFRFFFFRNISFVTRFYFEYTRKHFTNFVA